jgi:hypothetical protein
MNKGIRESSSVQLRDVGHTLAMFLERQYKNSPDFLSLMKELGQVKNREIMRDVAYLLPPKQRIIARFMNLTPCLHWAKKMLSQFDKLSKEEQMIFQFLKNHRLLVNELNGILCVFNQISQLLKKNGLSHKSVKICINKLIPLTNSVFPRVSRAAKECMVYLQEESGKLNAENSIWHISSDILESIFGIYKMRKSPDALNGVTSYVLMLPLLTKLKSEAGSRTIDFKESLEGIFLRDITKWTKDNLSENLSFKRRQKLIAA